MVIIIARKLELVARRSQQLYSCETVVVWCLASWHAQPDGKVPYTGWKSISYLPSLPEVEGRKRFSSTVSMFYVLILNCLILECIFHIVVYDSLKKKKKGSILKYLQKPHSSANEGRKPRFLNTSINQLPKQMINHSILFFGLSNLKLSLKIRSYLFGY